MCPSMTVSPRRVGRPPPGTLESGAQIENGTEKERNSQVGVIIPGDANQPPPDVLSIFTSSTACAFDSALGTSVTAQPSPFCLLSAGKKERSMLSNFAAVRAAAVTPTRVRQSYARLVSANSTTFSPKPGIYMV